MRDLISVIIPVYNAEKYLTRCLDSILSQSYTTVEVILIDDGSQDNSPALCDALAQHDARIRVIHQENQGVSAARNAGLTHASGKYIAFVDADDYLEQAYLERLYQNIQQYQADMACCGYTEVITTDLKPSTTPCVAQTRLISHPNEVYKDILSREESYWSCVWGKLILAEAAKKCRFLTTMKYGEDQVFFFDLISHIRSVHLDTFKGYYYVRTESSATMQKSQTDISRVLDELQMYVHRMNNLPEQASCLRSSFMEQYAQGLRAVVRAVALSDDPAQRKAYRPLLCEKIRTLFLNKNALSFRSKLYLSLYRCTPWLYRLLQKLR